MSQYLLSTYTVQGEVPGAPQTPQDMQAFMERINSLEAEMKTTGTFVFSGRLHEPDAATVFRPNGTDLVVTDGPFAEAKEQIAGFYIINADDHHAAMVWAKKVTEATNHPIEARPFFDTASA